MKLAIHNGRWLSGALVFAALGPSLHVPGPHLAAGMTLTAGADVLPTSTTPTTPSPSHSAS